MNPTYFKHDVSPEFNSSGFTLFNLLAKVVSEVIFSFYESELKKCNEVFMNSYRYALENGLVDQTVLFDKKMNAIIELRVNDSTRPFLSSLLLSGQKEMEHQLTVWKHNFIRKPEESLQTLTSNESSLDLRQVRSLLLRLENDFEIIDPLLSLKINTALKEITDKLIETKDEFPSPDGLYVNKQFLKIKGY
jgi:hypothetical protein